MRPFDLKYALDLMGTEPALREEMDRAWCVTSLILVGDRVLADGYYTARLSCAPTVAARWKGLAALRRGGRALRPECGASAGQLRAEVA